MRAPITNVISKSVIVLTVLIFITTLQKSTAKLQNEVHEASRTVSGKVMERQTVSETCVCGVGNRKRIVSGTVAQNGAYPWLAGIYWASSRTLFCGGAVIDNLYILTAAHCLQGVNEQDIFIVLGDYDQNTTTDAREKTYGVEKIIRHDQYAVKTRVDADIALLELNETISFQDNIQPICLPSAGTNFVGQTGTVAGWGTTSFGGVASPILLEVNLPVISDNTCKANFSAQYTENMMCVGFLDGSKDSCQGDSGGPLFLADTKNVNEIIGIVSFGSGCAKPGYPGVCTKVINYLKWISDNTQNSTACRRPSDEPPPIKRECGIRPPFRQTRIVGGANIYQPNLYPWSAAVLLKSATANTFDLRCGATLISNEWLITTGYCVDPFRTSIERLWVVLGEYDLSKYDGTEVQRVVTEIRIHPNFNRNVRITNDLALIRINPIVPNKAISPVCLPPSSWAAQSQVGMRAVATGWGWNNKYGTRTNTIEQELFINIIPNQNCTAVYGSAFTSNIICAGGIVGRDICNNDYGGQLSLFASSGNGDDYYVLYGVQAFGVADRCGDGFPSGFMRMTWYLSWIRDVTGLVPV